ncbi:urease accessory protein UreD [Advenella mimigardefordensis]|uniref:Urease accessory protein UreD n=1 Tax=Advenella mimigardefordensis (strain DSM 17166 / LMG 22922 / DPN7) TaxID=1247726 RepID=W0PH75_ADVMD|nr:urease accessory protein UreD [Advenella mimigardefordensis]AHG64288.1 urease accessory protein UreD [Advenella mimigardefordensis DPN7]
MSVVMETEQWTADLALAFSRQSTGRSALTRNIHSGPLLVQKPLYPEGPAVCHATLLHPPSGIAGGDELNIAVTVHEAAHAVLTTPGATRWYKANGKPANQTVTLSVEATARLDWLPLENLIFEQAQASNDTHIHLSAGAQAIGWDSYQLGSVAAQGHWLAGRISIHSSLHYDGKLVWTEAGQVDAQHPIRHRGPGLAGFPIMATVWSVGPAIGTDHMERLTGSLPWTDSLRAGASQMSLDASTSLIVVRLLGTHAEAVRHLMIACWQQLRPLHLGVAARPLRLWST